MVLHPSSFLGPFACFAAEGTMSAQGGAPEARSYRGSIPPSTEPVLIVHGVDIGAWESVVQRGLDVPSVPRLVAAHGDVAAFEYVPGIRLSELAAQARELGGELPVEAAAYIVAQAARAKAALRSYAEQVPVTSANVRVGFDGSVLLFVQRRYEANFDTIIGVIDFEPLWEPRTMPTESTLVPESARHQVVDADREEVFVLGSLLHYLLEGSHPYAADSMVATLERLAAGKPNALRRVVPGSLGRVLARALASEQTARQANALELATELERAMDLTGAQSVCAALTSSFFPHERAVQLEFVEELALAELDVTVEIDSSWQDLAIMDLRSLAERPLWVDESLVTNKSLAAFLQTAPALVDPASAHHLLALAAEPAVLVPPDVARAYARWMGGRLPTEEEWRFAAAAGVRDLTRVWEWTSTPARGGFIVRGGPWRNRDEPGRIDNRSYERVAAPDVGFRVVYDTEPGGRYVAAPRPRRR